MSQLFMEVNFSHLPWSVADYRNQFITHEWMHLTLLTQHQAVSLSATAPLWPCIGGVALPVQPAVEMQSS